MVTDVRENYATWERGEKADSATRELSGLVDQVPAFAHAGISELDD